ncbi:MAG TPA: hypothetical protein VGO00_29470 [Kofleriaceae bacterium]|nr:hypothetical protein [Kofleriaceae bacterium]
MTDDPKKPPDADDPTKRPDTDDGWEQPAPAADPIDPATGYVMHPADPAYPGTGPSSPASGPSSPGSGPSSPAAGPSSVRTGSPSPKTGPSEETGPSRLGRGPSRPASQEAGPGTGASDPETGSRYSEIGSGDPEGRNYSDIGSDYPAAGLFEPPAGPPSPEIVDPQTGAVYPEAGAVYPEGGAAYPGAAGAGPEAGPFEPLEPPDPVTGYVSYSSPPMDPVTGLPLQEALDVPPPNPDDAPILPPTYDYSSLRGDTAVPDAAAPKPKAKPKRRDDDDDDGDDPRKNRRMVWVVAGSVIAGITSATFALLGRANTSKYVIACDADKIIAEQGRAFPPWGVTPIQGAEWKPITIAPNGECKPRETDDADELEGWYLAQLIDQASALLTAREVTKPDVAAEQLNQALLLARSPDRRDQRKDIERLLGDVDYWRASAKLRDAATALGDAAKQFDSAAAQRPRHVSDAAAWASYLRKLVDQLHAGPAGGTQTAFPPLPAGAERQPAPPGVALPVEPSDQGSDVPALAPPDAGAPSGGVLL